MLTSIVVFVLSIVALDYTISSTQCGLLGSNSSLDTKYSYWVGCYIELDGQWVPDHVWRVSQVKD